MLKYLTASGAVVSGAALLAVIAAGQAHAFQEAPALAAMVASGALPPVDERLPAAPMVIPVVEQIGTYGGRWDEYVSGPAEDYKIQRAGAYENLVTWNADFSGVEPNIAESWDISDDGREYTFHLREGIRWSDGEPFSADDIMFAFHDVLSSPELSPGGVPSWLKPGGEPPALEKIDDHTIKFTFDLPQGLFMELLAHHNAHGLTHFPRHYLEQFHAAYNPDGIDALVQEAGASNWAELFQQQRWLDTFGANPDVPVLYPWMVATPYGGSAAQLVFDRNPYYWKVDEEGNQLPYIDQVVFHIIQDVELTAVAMMNGDVDSLMLGDDAAAVLTNKALFSENMGQGNYRILPVFFPGTFRVIPVNLVHKDPAMREILGNRDFRIGLSYAINRPEIIDLLYFGQGEGHQAAPSKGSRYYDEEFVRQYTEYDVDLANAYLDKVLPTKDAEGFRLMPNGDRFTMTFIMINRPDDTDLFELLVNHWADVGLDISFDAVDRSLRNARMQANDYDGFTFGGANGALGDELLNPRWFLPIATNSYWALPWATWYTTNGQAGEEPPEEVRRQMELYTQAITAADPDVRDELAREIFQISKEQFYVIGVAAKGGDYVIVDNALRNVPDELSVGPSFFRVAPVNPAQFYFEGGNG